MTAKKGRRRCRHPVDIAVTMDFHESKRDLTHSTKQMSFSSAASSLPVAAEQGETKLTAAKAILLPTGIQSSYLVHTISPQHAAAIRRLMIKGKKNTERRGW